MVSCSENFEGGKEREEEADTSFHFEIPSSYLWSFESSAVIEDHLESVFGRLRERELAGIGGCEEEAEEVASSIQ